MQALRELSLPHHLLKNEITPLIGPRTRAEQHVTPSPNSNPFSQFVVCLVTSRLIVSPCFPKTATVERKEIRNQKRLYALMSSIRVKRYNRNTGGG